MLVNTRGAWKSMSAGCTSEKTTRGGGRRRKKRWLHTYVYALSRALIFSRAGVARDADRQGKRKSADLA